MKKKQLPERALKRDEKILWNLVTRTVSPMHGQTPKPPPDISFEDAMKASGSAPLSLFKRKPVPEASPNPRSAKPTPSPSPIAAYIDKPVYRKIAKGRVPIDSRIDLHDMTQEQAVARLQAFLKQAHAMGQRHVLVITGKGGSPTSEGVLRRMLPVWLNTPAFAGIVNGYQSAARGHGGEGAFYVRLRRQRGQKS